jgi:hypothetical protein
MDCGLGGAGAATAAGLTSAESSRTEVEGVFERIAASPLGKANEQSLSFGLDSSERTAEAD